MHRLAALCLLCAVVLVGDWVGRLYKLGGATRLAIERCVLYASSSWAMKTVAGVAAFAAAILLCLPSTTRASYGGPPIPYGNTSWHWGSPRPQGVPLSEVDFEGRRGYAAGAEGVLLRSDDSGSTWRSLAPGTVRDFSSVEALGAGVLVVSACELLLRSDDSGRTFRRLALPPVTALRPRGIFCPSRRAVDFVDRQLGYLLLEDGMLLRTRDGGASFEQRGFVPRIDGRESDGSVAFLDADTGLVVGNGRAGDQASRILRTDDGGASWRLVHTTSPGLSAIEVASAGTVYATGNGELLRSDDGGERWSAAPLSGAPRGTPRSISCATASACLVLLAVTSKGEAPTSVPIRTGDGGRTARAVSVVRQGLGADSYDADFAPGGRAVVVGDLGQILVSDDLAEPLRELGGIHGPIFEGTFRTLGRRTIITTGPLGSDLAWSNDAGHSWRDISLPVPRGHFVHDFSFLNQKTGFVLTLNDGSKAALLRTHDGGRSWRLGARGTQRGYLAILALGPRRLLAAGTGGMQLSRDDGRRFRPVADRAVRRVHFFEFDRAGPALLAYGYRAAAVSFDNGARWRRVSLPERRIRVRELDFATPQVGYLVTLSGVFFKTTNGGKSWRRVLSVGAYRLSDLSFADAQHGIVDASFPRRSFDPDGFDGSSRILRTSDGGRTWAPELDVANTRLSDVRMIDRRRSVAEIAGDIIWNAGPAPVRTSLSLAVGRRRSGDVRVTGELHPSTRGDKVRISARTGARWVVRRAAVDEAGRFRSTLKVGPRARFLAQFTGGSRRRGAATPVLRQGEAR